MIEIFILVYMCVYLSVFLRVRIVCDILRSVTAVFIVQNVLNLILI